MTWFKGSHSYVVFNGIFKRLIKSVATNNKISSQDIKIAGTIPVTIKVESAFDCSPVDQVTCL